MTTEPTTFPDLVEDALDELDVAYCAVYGPNPATWSKGVRGEYRDQLRTRRTVDREAHPVHPRRASAARRRRHYKQLGYRVHQIAPGAATVLLTPVWTDPAGTAARSYVVTARSADCKQRLQLPTGGSQRLAALMQGAFPAADWDQPQTWHADTNTLTTWGQTSRAFRESADAGFVESLNAYTARTARREAD
ncbi:hypothetical protein U9R90_05485 [Streptomyces sp. E11-3]|uniref:hypothetical protein n=1 Tax=Streptomyces sp. E11-3 TaxID=3110112 RepID=UPI00398179C3